MIWEYFVGLIFGFAIGESEYRWGKFGGFFFELHPPHHILAVLVGLGFVKSVHLMISDK